MKLRLVIFLFIGMSITYTAIRSSIAVNTERAIRTAIRDLKEEGLTIRFKEMQEGGFPFRITYQLNGVSLTDQNGFIRAQLDQITLISHVWTPNHWMADYSGADFSFFNDDIRVSDQQGVISYKRADDGSTTLVLDSQEETTPVTADKFPGLRTKAQISRLVASALIPAEADSDQKAGDGGLYEKTIANFRLQMAGITIHKGLEAHQKITGVEVTGSLTGDGLKSWNRQSLRDWGMAGGLIKIDALNIALPKAALGASGSISVDENLYPLGSLSLQSRGNKAWADALQSADLLISDAAYSALETMPEKQDISLLIQYGSVIMGDILLMRTKSIR